MGTIKATNIEPIADNGTVTLGSSGDTFSLGSGVIQSNLNNPAFEATLGGDTTISDVTVTLVPFNVVTFDTNSCYSTTTYKFTPNVAGKYYVYCSVMADAIGGSDLRRTSARIYKNDAHYKSVQWLQDTNRARQQNPYVVGLIDMNGTTDNLSVYAYLDDNSGSPKLESGVRGNSFGAYRIGT
tara:strand:+ start:613 stop:1161 length:549 start_codon:yes stop_codon:yes gene_type:complete